MYIKEAINYFYCIYGNDIKLTSISLEGKGNFQNKLKTINNHIHKYEGDSVVVFCLDLDSQLDSTNKELNKNINDFCRRNNIRLVWFNEEIEEVFLGYKVEKRKKTNQAIHFIRSNKIKKVPIGNLSNEYFNKISTSNFLNVFDQIIGEFRRK